MSRGVIIAGSGALSVQDPTLRRQPLDVVRVETGLLACDALRHERPHLLIVSEDLPDMTVLALVRQIRADDELRQVSILYVGEANDAGRAEQVQRAGANSVLLRPCERTLWEETIASLAGVDTRRRARLLVRVEIERPQGGSFQVGFTQNLSVGGMLLEVDATIAIGEQLDLRFFVPGGAAETVATAEVVRLHAESEHHRVVGVKLTQLADADRDRITTFVEQSAGR